MPEDLPELPGRAELFDAAPCGLLVTTTTGLILEVNATFCRWVGMSAEELVQRKKLQELFTMGGRIFHQTHWLPMLEMQGSLSEVKFDLRKADGQLIPVLMNAIRHHRDEGSFDQMSVIVARERNQYERELLAARKRADELVVKERLAQGALRATQSRLQQAMQVGAIFVWDVDPATRVRRFGDEVALLLGYPTPRPIGEAEFLAAIASDDDGAERDALAQAVEGGGSYHWTYSLGGVDGVRRIIVSSGQGFVDDSGRLIEFVGTLTDITETYRLREAAEDRALFAEQMVGIVSHDLRNPLQSIQVANEVLSRSGDISSEKATRLLGSVGRASRRAQRLIEDLLDFTAIRVGRGLSVNRIDVDVHAVVGRAVEELSLAFPNRGLEHRIIGEGEVSADPDRIVQLIGNLVGNAMSYGDPERVVTVTSTISASEVGVAVHNFGIPIPPDVRATLFEPMVRGGAVDNSIRSVGLGLFIVRAIALAHDGGVDFTSDVAAGTEFFFRFER